MKYLQVFCVFLFLSTLFFTKTQADTDIPNIQIKKETKTKNLIKKKGVTKTKEKIAKIFIGNISAYTASIDECGKSDGITASGKLVRENHTIACPKEYKFGTKIKIEGFGTYVCEDRGGAIKGNKFDIYMKTKTQAFAFGRRRLKVTVYTLD